jgi:hypothetical protein
VSDLTLWASYIARQSSVTEPFTLWSVFAYENPSEFCKSVRIFIVVSKQPFLVCYTIIHENEIEIPKNASEDGYLMSLTKVHILSATLF